MAARKARAEGARAKPAPKAPEKPVEAAPEPEATAEEVKHPDPVPGDDGEALQRISASFQARFAEDWANIRLTPLQHGIEAMADILRSR